MKIKNIANQIYKAFLYSLSGFNFLRKERAFRDELIILPFLAAYILVYDISSLIKLYLISSYALVLITEALNTCVETVVNRISTDLHDLSKKAKDIGSAAVLISLIHLAIVFLYSLFCAVS